MFAYEYKQIPIDNLHFMDLNSNNFYNYKGLNFLAKLSDSNSNLVVSFHGAVRGFGKDRVVFRGYNYKIPNTDLVCISDYLMNVYDEYQVNWALSSAKYNSESIYVELFKYLIELKNYKNVIFTGSSAGGYPSIYYASYFNQIALISNPQLYLEKYGFAHRNNKNPWGFYNLAKLLVSNGDAVIYEPKDIERHILNSKPKKIILYNNKFDTHTLNEHSLPFVEFMKQSGLENIIELNVFEGEEPPEGKTHHEIGFPNKRSHYQIVCEFIKNL